MEDDFGKRLKRLLSQKGLKQKDLVAKTGFSKERISQWCNNKYKPDGNGVAILANVLNVNPNYLMGISDNMSYDPKELEMQYQVCDLFQKCYGKDAYRTVHEFLKLDEADRNTIMSNIQFLLSNDKYTKKKESLNA